MARRASNRVFRESLRKLIDTHHNGNAAAFARKAGIPQPSIAYYLRGKRYPTPEALDRLLHAFEPQARGELVAAFIADLTPLAARELVHLQVDGFDQPLPAADLPPRTRDAMQYLQERAAESDDVRLFIEATARAMRGK